MGHERDQDSVARLAGELGRLGRRLIGRVVERVDADGPLELPMLYALAAQHCAEEWSTDKVAGLEALIRRAALKLDGSFGGPRGVMSNREAAFWLFNLAGGSIFPQVEKRDVESLGAGRDQDGQEFGGKYDEIYHDLVARARLTEVLGGDSPATIRRPFTTLRRALAEALLDLDSIATVRTSDTAPLAPPADSQIATMELDGRPLLADAFVRRPDYEALIRRQRDSATRLIWLHGDAGTGKTRLARAANRDLMAEHLVPVVRADDRVRLEQDLADLITAGGGSPDSVNTTNVWAMFNAVLASGHAPPVIVFDNAPAETEILGRIRGTGTSLLIITSRYTPPEGFTGLELRVDEMESLELDAMVRSRLPGASDAERSRLADAVGGRPLAIEHSAAFIRGKGIRVADYCSALTEQPAATLDAAGDGRGATLTRIYRLTLKWLAESPDALRALDLLVLGTDGLPAEALMGPWADRLELSPAMPDTEMGEEYFLSASLWCGAWSGVQYVEPTRFPRFDPLTRVRFHAALGRLERAGLVRSDGGLLVLHPLTRAILRDLRAGQAHETYERIVNAFYVMLRAENWRGGDVLSFDRLWWAQGVREALGNAVRDPRQAVELPTDDLVRLATVAGATLRADRQIGNDPTRSFETATALAIAMMMRRDALSASAPEREVVLGACQDVCLEVIEYLVLLRPFDRAVDSFPNPGAPPTAFQTNLANSVRLRYATEWEPAHHHGTDLTARKQHAATARRATRAENVSATELRASADAALAAATIHYDACEWDQAVDALEHAYECYLKIGASTECIRGAMDAARRLSRVHVRSGRLDDAQHWLGRAWTEVYVPRCEITMSGGASFRLRDRLLEHQLVQAKDELDLTLAVTGWDRVDGDFGPGAQRAFAEPRLPLARRALEVATRINAERLLPELAMHVRRLEGLTGSPSWISDMDTWFDPENRPYQHSLVRLQVMTIAAPYAGMILALNDQEVAALTEPLPDELRAVVTRIRTDRTEPAYELIRVAQEVGVTHANPYWHARGLCAAVMLATAADDPDDASWLATTRDTTKRCAEAIGRPDWADKTDGFLDDNGGLWLLGY